MSELDTLRDVLQHRGEVRIELSLALMANPPGSSPCARLYVRNDSNRWVKVDVPLLLPAEGQGRGDLLRLLASLAEEKPLAVTDEFEVEENSNCRNCNATRADCIDGGEAICCDRCDHLWPMTPPHAHLPAYGPGDDKPCRICGVRKSEHDVLTAELRDT